MSPAARDLRGLPDRPNQRGTDLSDRAVFEIDAEWVHLQYAEHARFKDVYGFSGSQGFVNLEGIRYVPRDCPSRTLLVYMHPSSTLQLLPMPKAMAQYGLHVLCAGSRYARNDSALVMENVVLDLGAYIRHARQVWAYEKIVLVGWSGGGSLSLFYQSQAEKPSITQTPAGDPCNLVEAGLSPADAVIFQAAHVSRAELLVDWIDPSVLDEERPEQRDPSLDLYHPDNRPPYSDGFLTAFRAAQLARVRRRTAWVKRLLESLRAQGGLELERGFVTHRTLAEPRFLDARIDPNDRPIGTCYLGVPETVNSGPIGLARFSTLRAWLSQWSIDDTRAHGVACVAHITVPFLAIEHSADDAVPQPHTRRVFDAAASTDKSLHVIQGATHYFSGQPAHLGQAVALYLDWLDSRGLR